MLMKKIFNRVSRMCYDHGLGLLVIRVATGLVFFIHGYDKLQAIDGTIRLMQLLGLGGAGTAYFIAWLEVVGGIALMLGIAARLFSVLFGIEMTVAAFSIGNTYGFHGYEMPLLLAAISFGLVLAGSGKFSIFKMECTYCGGMLCRGASGECSIR